MANTIEENEREIGTMVKEMMEGGTSELTGMLPHIDLSKKIPDAEIKKAILNVSPDGMNKLFSQFGQQRVMDYFGQFTQGRRF